MKNNKSFQAAKTKHLRTLRQYVPVVARVHGKNHPEFLEVQTLFEALSEKLRGAGSAKSDLLPEFTALRAVTRGYTVPEDVCESYEAVYKMLGELDSAYQASEP